MIINNKDCKKNQQNISFSKTLNIFSIHSKINKFLKKMHIASAPSLEIKYFIHIETEILFEIRLNLG